MVNEPSVNLHYPEHDTRICLKCHRGQPIGQFTSAGTQRANICDTCVGNWRTDQHDRGNTGFITHKERKKSLGKNNP